MAKKRKRNIIEIIRGLWASFISGKGNAKTIFLCFLTAFIFWFFNSLNKDYSTRLDYPITFEFNKDSLISKNNLPTHLSIFVTGGGWNLLRKTIGFSVDPIKIKLSNQPNQSFLSESNLLTIAADQLEELTVNYIITDTILIDIDIKADKKLKLSLDTSALSLASDYLVVSDIMFIPDSVLLTGPQTLLKNFDNELKLVLPDSDIDEDYSERIPVSMTLHPTISSIPDKVEVQFEVEKFETHSLQVKIVRQDFPDKKVSLLSATSTNIILYLPESKIGQLDTTSIRAIADYTDFNAKDSTIILQASSLPEFIKSYTFEDPSVKVIYQ